jgi:ParB-like chromosome segregation protein Spo0J
MAHPPLRPLHPDTSLIQLKLTYFSRLSTDELVLSLQLGQKDSLKARPDGTILDGHHRIAILQSRGVDVDVLPREIILKDSDGS